MERKFRNVMSNFSLLSEFEFLQKSGELTDTVLVGMNGKVAVHSVILTQYSTFWKTMISQAKGEIKTVLLPQHGLDDLMVFVEKLYSSSVPIENNVITNDVIIENQQKLYSCDDECIKHDANKSKVDVLNEDKLKLDFCNDEGIKNETDKPEKELREIEENNSSILKCLKNVELKSDNIMFQCSQCSKTLLTMIEMESHIKDHNQRKTHQCEMCSLIFKFPSELKRHIPIHTGEIFPCSKCSKTFSAKRSLMEHERTHAFTCNVCFKSFSKDLRLKVHMKKHTREKSFKCTDCSKSFLRKAELKSHKAIHSQERLFSCDQCPKSFKQRGTLFIHVKSFHKVEKPFLCSTCSRSFTFRN